MRAVMVEVPEGLLEERRSTGADRWDEVWDGVLHMVPPPTGDHQRFGTELLVALFTLAKDKGLVSSHETGHIRPGRGWDDYRQPDLIFARPENATDAGVEGRAELVVEILSPSDESYEKLGFYADLEVQEVLIVSPADASFELFVLRDDRLEPATPDGTGRFTLHSVGATIATVEGPALRVTWPGGHVDVPAYPPKGNLPATP